MTTTRVDNLVLQSQIDGIGVRMDKGFDELKSMLGGYDGRLRELEKSDASSHPLMESRLDAAWRRIDEHTTAIGISQKTADMALMVANKLESISKWMLGILTAVIVAFVVAVITGRVELIIK
jgi:hypothetical protein